MESHLSHCHHTRARANKRSPRLDDTARRHRATATEGAVSQGRRRTDRGIAREGPHGEMQPFNDERMEEGARSKAKVRPALIRPIPRTKQRWVKNGVVTIGTPSVPAR